jgi:hypothetical protein
MIDAALHSKLSNSSYLVTKAAVSLYDGNAAATLTLTGTWPTGKTGRLKITISSVAGHTDCAGTMTVGSETLTFTQAATKLTTTSLTANPSVTTSGLDCYIHITVIDVAGQDIIAETLTSIDVSWNDTQKYIPDSSGGWTVITETYATTDNSSIVAGDVLRKTSAGTDYKVRAVKPINNFLGLEIKRKLIF